MTCRHGGWGIEDDSPRILVATADGVDDNGSLEYVGCLGASGFRGSGPNLRSRFARYAEHGPQTRFGSPPFPDLDLNIRSGPGPNPVHKVRTSNRGQYRHLGYRGSSLAICQPESGCGLHRRWGIRRDGLSRDSAPRAWSRSRHCLSAMAACIRLEDHNILSVILSSSFPGVQKLEPTFIQVPLEVIRIRRRRGGTRIYRRCFSRTQNDISPPFLDCTSPIFSFLLRFNFFW